MNKDDPRLDPEDIQGNLLSGYAMRCARHFALAVADAAGACRLIGDLVDGDAKTPQLMRASRWNEGKPTSAINLGVTFEGLKVLGVSDTVLKSFPLAFREGPAQAARATSLGDTEASAPSHWVLGGHRNPTVHLMLSVYADAPTTIGTVSAPLRAQFAAHGIHIISEHEAEVFFKDETRVHFGYRDGISQPRIAGTPAELGRQQLRDPQPPAPAGDFLLGRDALGQDYVNSFCGNHLGDLPLALGNNATYGAFRVLSQDVFGFERLLRDTARRWNLDPEWLAAKLMGRWRNGVPLSLSPESAYRESDVGKARPRPTVDDEHLNNFDYTSTPGHPDRYEDRIGLRCPVGSHIRRLNPRSGLAMGKPYSRRLIRRGMPYGPRYEPEVQGYEEDGVERGLIGYFLCGDLELQFEFIQRVWVNDDMSAAGLRGTREPIMGAHPEHGGRFVIRTDSLKDPIILTDLPRLVTTRGSVYCLLPGIGGLRYLAALGSP